MSEGPAFSAIVTVFHSRELLARALESLCAQDLPGDRFEVIVAGPADDAEAVRATESAAASAPCRLEYVPVESRRRAAQLNAGCAVARGQVWAFTDDDCVLPPDWLSALGRVIESGENVGAVSGPDEYVPGHGTFGPGEDWVLNSFMGTGGCRKGRGAHVGAFYPRLFNMAVPRRVALEVALGKEDDRPLLFDERLPVHENVELGRRLAERGYRTVYAPQAVVRHYRASRFAPFIGRNFQMARVSRTLGTHRLPHLALAAFVVGGALLVALSVFLPAVRPALYACLAAYAGVVLASGLVAACQMRRPIALLTVPLLLACLHTARGVGYLFPLSLRRPSRHEEGA